MIYHIILGPVSDLTQPYCHCVAVDFSTGERPWPIFNLQKEFNAPGKSPPLSA